MKSSTRTRAGPRRNKLTRTQLIARFRRPFDLKEMQAAESEGAKNTPGADGTTPAFLRNLDPKIKVKFLEECNQYKSEGKIPTQWKLGRMRNLWKENSNGDGRSAAHWRGINIPQACFTLFMRMWARRLTALMVDLGVISKNQKANLPGVNGAADWNVYLRAALTDVKLGAAFTKSKEKYLTLIFTDIWKAFDTVDRGVVLESIRAVLGQDIGHEFLGMISSLYENREVVISNRDESITLSKKSGTDQGNPISPLLFMIVMEFASRLVVGTEQDNGYKFFLANKQEDTDCIFADDNMRITGADDIQTATLRAQADLEKFRTQMKAVGLTVSAKKCKALAIRSGRTDGDRDSAKLEAFVMRLTIDGERIHMLPLEDTFRNLGLFTNGSGDQHIDTDRRITKFISSLAAIEQSGLTTTRKLDAIKKVSTIHLEYTFAYVTWRPKDLEAMTKHLRYMVRRLWGVKGLPNALMHAPKGSVGGLDLPTSFIKCLQSGDTRIQRALYSNILLTQRYYDIVEADMDHPELSPRNPSFFKWGNWIESQIPNTHTTNMVIASCRIAKELGVSLRLETDRTTHNPYQLPTGKLTIKIKGQEIVGVSKLRAQLFRTLRAKWIKQVRDRQSTNLKKSKKASGSST